MTKFKSNCNQKNRTGFFDGRCVRFDILCFSGCASGNLRYKETGITLFARLCSLILYTSSLSCCHSLANVLFFYAENNRAGGDLYFILYNFGPSYIKKIHFRLFILLKMQNLIY